ncbi:MAG: hypothetical protein ACI4FY_03380 [Acetatifactor sp.]
MDRRWMETLQAAMDDAEMILVGLGEEWDEKRVLKDCAAFRVGQQCLEENELTWLIPAWNDYCLTRVDSKAADALDNLQRFLGEKNYFVISTSTNSLIAATPWREGRLVMPCGTAGKKQCGSDYEKKVMPLTNEDRKKLFCLMEELWELCGEGADPDQQELAGGIDFRDRADRVLGICDICGRNYRLNTVYTDDYREEGYLPQWNLYTKWLQGTVNRKLLILELGVGMQFYTIIRFPFEKIAFYNQKCRFFRINEKLYQLTPELKEKGMSVSENVVDCFATLC